MPKWKGKQTNTIFFRSWSLCGRVSENCLQRIIHLILFFIFRWFLHIARPLESKKSFLLKIDFNETKMMLNFLAILNPSAQCAVCKVQCHCIFYGPGIRYSDIFGAPGIGYSVIIKFPCALLQTGHLATVHAPVADIVTYFAGLDAPVMDTVTYFGGNHRSRV